MTGGESQTLDVQSFPPAGTIDSELITHSDPRGSSDHVARDGDPTQGSALDVGRRPRDVVFGIAGVAKETRAGGKWMASASAPRERRRVSATTRHRHAKEIRSPCRRLGTRRLRAQRSASSEDGGNS